MSFLAPKTDLGQTTAPERQSYEATGPVPVVFGRARIGLKLLESPFNFQQQNISDKLAAVNIYTLVAVGCHGPVQKLIRLWVNGKPAWWPETDRGSADYTDLPTHGWDRYTMHARVYWGTETQTADPLLTGTARVLVTDKMGTKSTINPPKNPDGSNRVHPAYTGLFYVICYFMPFDYLGKGGAGQTTLPHLEAEVLVAPPDDQSTNKTNGSSPIAIGREILINKIWGANLPASLVPRGAGDPDYNGWADAAYALDQDGYFHQTLGAGNISPVLGTSQDLASHMASILSLFDGYLRLRAGVLLPGWFANQYDPDFDPDTVTTLTRNDMLDEPDIDIDGWDETVNEVSLKFLNASALLEEQEIKERSTYNTSVLGRGSQEKVEAGAIIDYGQAKRMAQRILRERAYPGCTFRLKVLRGKARNPDGSLLLPGDRCYVNYAPYALQILCRVIERTDEAGRVTLQLVKERGVFAEDYVEVEDSRQLPGVEDPGEITSWRLFELPAELYGREWPPAVAIIAERPNNSVIYANAWISPTSDFAADGAELEPLGRFAIPATLDGAIDDDDAVLTVAFSADNPPPGLNRSYTEAEQTNGEVLLLIGSELISLGAQYGTPGAADRAYNVRRGMYGTTPAAHLDEAVVWVVSREFLLAVAYAHESLRYAFPYSSGAATVYFRLAAATALETGDPNTAQSIVLADRTPGTVTGLSATYDAATGRIALAWTDPVSTLLKDIAVWRRIGPSGDYRYLASVAKGVQQYFDADLFPGAADVIYYYQLKAYGTIGGESAVASANDTVDKIGAPDLSLSIPSGAYYKFRASWTAGSAGDWIVLQYWETANSGVKRILWVLDNSGSVDIEVDFAGEVNCRAWRVKVVKGVNCTSDASDTETATSAKWPAPTGFTLNSGNGISWTLPSGVNPDLIELVDDGGESLFENIKRYTDVIESAPFSDLPSDPLQASETVVAMVRYKLAGLWSDYSNTDDYEYT